MLKVQLLTTIRKKWSKKFDIRPQQTDSLIVFARLRQCALLWRHIGAPWRIRLNLCFLGPTRVHNPSIANRSMQPLLHSSWQSLYTLQWAPLSPEIAPSHRRSEPHLIFDSLSQYEPITQNQFSRFCTDDYSVPTLYNGSSFYLKIAPSHGDLNPHLIHGSLGPPESSAQMASWLVQPFLQGSLCDRQTDRQTTLLGG